MPQRAGKGRGKGGVVGSRTQQQCPGTKKEARQRGGRRHTRITRDGTRGDSRERLSHQRAASGRRQLSRARVKAHAQAHSPPAQSGSWEAASAWRPWWGRCPWRCEQTPTNRKSQCTRRRTRSLAIARWPCADWERGLHGRTDLSTRRRCGGRAGGASLNSAGLAYRRQAGRPSQALCPLRQC